MARILGIEIPNEKRIEASLPYMFGIGRPTAAKILEHAGIDPNIRTGQLSTVHDVSDGGLGLAVIEMAMASGLGASLPALTHKTVKSWT